LKAHRESGGTVLTVHFKLCRVCFRQANFELMQTDSLQVDPEEKQQLDKIDPVDNAQAEEFLNTWY